MPMLSVRPGVRPYERESTARLRARANYLGPKMRMMHNPVIREEFDQINAELARRE
jgi:hypothetical protein